MSELFPSLDELAMAAEAVRATVASPGWVAIARVLEAEIATIDRDLDGSDEPMSQAEYALAHGRRYGLRGADEAAGAILRKAEFDLRRQKAKHENGAAVSVAGGG